MDIGKRIKERRKELGLSAEIIAEKIGVSPATVYRYESADIMNMGIDKVELIANALSTSPAYLMGWTDEQPLTLREQHLFSDFRNLSPLGQDKAIDYVADLADNPKYQKEDAVQETPAPYIPEVMAAHHPTGKLDETDRKDIDNILQYIADDKKQKGLL